MLVAEGADARPPGGLATPARPLRVLVVEDHEVLRSGLRWLLGRVPWVERCAAAHDADTALELASSIAFDLALVDVDLGGDCGLATCERLAAHVPTTALLTSRWDLVPMRTARQVGARGVIAKDRPARALLAAVRDLGAGGACEPEPARAGEVRFIPRERRILRLVGAGLTNAEIGASLHLAPGTIKHHMLGLYGKLDAPNRAAAVHTARRLGVLADHRVDRAPDRAPAGARVRVLVADADDVRRAGLLLALHPGAAVLGARDTADALAAVASHRPDVALAGDDELSRALSRTGLRTLLVRDDETGSPAELRAAGASGVVRQWWTAARLADAVQRAGRGPREAGGSSVATGASAPDPVSPREREVLSAFATGATNPAIADALGLSPNTVKQHASSIFRKLGVRNRAEAVRRANDLGLLAA